QASDDAVPRLNGEGLAPHETFTGPLCRPVRLQAPVRSGLDAPDGRVVADLAAGGLPRRLGVDAPAAKLLREGLPPALQIGLARIETLAVARLGAHADV